jgi:hypothetical protein
MLTDKSLKSKVQIINGKINSENLMSFPTSITLGKAFVKHTQEAELVYA